MDLVSCGKCGKIHARGKCTVKRIYNKTDTDRLRSKSRWTQKAKQIKEESLYLCAVCRQQGIFTYNDLEVHHITKLKEDPGGLLEDYNLICLCTKHHKEADSGKIAAEYLRELARERAENQPGDNNIL